MKTLKNESTSYMEQIFAAITEYYRKNAEPANAALMNLYSFTGRCIWEQGEKAFVVYLAEQLAQRFPLLKGFSPRNLRRMRDFYRSYQNSPSLMAKALMLGWTQNTVILECCDTDSQRSFYLGLAAEQSLSKIALTKAIETNAFEAVQNAEVAQQNTTMPCAAVYQIAPDKTADTAKAAETACGVFVPACERFRQGDTSSMDDGISKASSDNMLRKLLVIQEVIEFARIINVYLKQPNLQAQLFKPPPTAQPPPLAVLIL